MAISDFVLALCVLLSTILAPVYVLYQMLRLRRRAIRVTASAPPLGNHR